MTLPSGFPDWQNVPAWHARSIQASTTIVPQTVTTTLINRDIGNFGNATLSFQLLSGSVRLHIYVATSTADAFPVETHRYVMGTETRVVVSIPLRGRAILVTADGAVAGDSEIFYTVHVSNTGVERTTYWAPEDHFTLGVGTLTPGATFEHFPPYLLPGPALLSFEGSGAVGMVGVQIRIKGFGGAADTVLVRFVPATGIWLREFIVPATRWCLRVINNDGVNRNYGFGVAQGSANV